MTFIFPRRKILIVVDQSGQHPFLLAHARCRSLAVETWCIVRILALTSDNYTESFQRWYGKRWIQTLGPIVESIKLRVYPTFRVMQIDYPELQNPPPELMAKPEFDPLIGPWENIYREKARETLYAAWMTALNERNRRHRPPKVWRGFIPKPQPVSWIEKTLKEDA